MSDPANVNRRMYEVIRVVSLILIAIAVVACAMAVKGLQWASILLAAVIVLMGGLVIVKVTRAIRELRAHSLLLQQAAGNTEEHYVSVLRRVVKFVESRDKYMHGRSERIGKLTQMMAEALKFAPDKCRMMNIAGQLHDIGLLAVPDGVLGRQYTLGGSDYRTVKRHAEISYEVLRPLTSFAPILPAIRYHHERMNGTGYPAGLKGDAIPMEARILAVADTYDSMTHDRPHRPAMTPLEAMKELRHCTPAGYDKACVEALAEIVNLAELEPAMPQKCAQTAGIEQMAGS